MGEMIKFVQSSVVHVRDEHVLNKRKEPRVGPTLKKTTVRVETLKETPTWEKMDLAEAACLVSGTKSRAMFRASALGMSLRSIRRHKTCVQGFDISIDTFRIRQFTPAYSSPQIIE